LKEIFSLVAILCSVELGHAEHTKNIFHNIYEVKTWFWPHTVQLTLSVQYPFELVVILRNDVIPYLEHLNVTIEQEQFEEKPYLKTPPPNIELCKRDIRQMADATRLQTLVLRHLALSQLVILLHSLKMPLLKKLTLVDIFDESKLSNLY